MTGHRWRSDSSSYVSTMPLSNLMVMDCATARTRGWAGGLCQAHKTCLGPRACAYSVRSLHRDLALAVLVLRNAEQLAVCEEVKELVGGPEFGKFKGGSVRGSSDGPR